jgi:hypothetical protein
MRTKTITIHVGDDAARVYESATRAQRQKLDALLSLQLSRVGRSPESLRKIIHEASQEAAEHGLTMEILQDILNGE